jgi:hypothetical protein
VAELPCYLLSAHRYQLSATRRLLISLLKAKFWEDFAD